MQRIRLTIFACLLTTLFFALPAYAQDALPLTQHFRADDGRLAFNYPADWITQLDFVNDDDISAYIASSDNALQNSPMDSPDNILLSGDVRVYLDVAPKAMTAGYAGMILSDSVSDIAPMMLRRLSPDNVKVLPGEVEELKIGNYPAALLPFSIPRQADGYLMLVQYVGGKMAEELFYAPPGELPQWKATGLAIVESLTFDGAPEATPEATAESTPDAALGLTETYTNNSGTISFNYPAGWALDQSAVGSALLDITVASAQSILLDRPGVSTFAPGDVILQVEMFDQSVMLQIPGVTESSTPVEVLQANFPETATPPDGITWSKISAITINDQPAAQIHIGEGSKGEGTVVLYLYQPGVYVLLGLFTAQGELAQWEPTMNGVAASLHYADASQAAPEATEAGQ